MSATDHGVYRAPAILAACDHAHDALDAIAWQYGDSDALARHHAALTACAELAALDARGIPAGVAVPDVFGTPGHVLDYVAACRRLADHATGTVAELWAEAVHDTAVDVAYVVLGRRAWAER